MIEKIRDAQLKSVRSAEKSQKAFQKESESSTKRMVWEVRTGEEGWA